jgi:hypothetical protein
MHQPKIRIIFLCVLLLFVMTLLTGCQMTRNLDEAIREISMIPSRLGRVIIDLMSGIGNIGDALANQVGNIIKGMTGH